MFLRSGSVYDNADDGMMGYHVIFGFQQANMNKIYPGPDVLVVWGFYPDN